MIQWNNLKELLNGYREKIKLSKATGISTGNISDWFNPNKPAQPSAEALVNIAEYFDCSVDYLMDRTDVNEINYEPKTIHLFPQYKQKAAAGVGQLGRDSNYIMKKYTIDNIPETAVYTMEIAGESMNHKDTNNLIHTGSIVVINPRYIESELYNKIVIVNFKGQIICKRYIDKGEYILFQSDNNAFENENRRSSDDPDCKILGIVLGVIENEKFVPVK